MLYPLFVRHPMVPAGAEEIPGMWKNKHNFGCRIPLNSLDFLGLDLFSKIGCVKSDTARVEKILESSAFLPWVRDVVMPHQMEIVSRAIVRPGYHAWSPPGSGKTLCGLLWLAAAVKKPKLVITKAAARGTWREEIRKFTRFQPKVLSGIKDIEKIQHDPRCIYIVAWETLIAWEDALLKLRPHSVVYDEIHWAKNPKRVKPVLLPNGKTRFDRLGNTASCAAEISKVAERRFGLTATPIPNRPKDLWAQLDLVEPWQWGTFHKFGERYCAGFKDLYGWKYDGISNEDELVSRLEWVRYKTDQKAILANLPPKRRQFVYLDRDEQNSPSAFKRDIQNANKSGDKSSIFETMLFEAASRKRKYVIGRVKEAVGFGQKVVVFTGRRSDCDRLGKEIQNAVDVAVWCAHGGTSTSERDKIRIEYMESTDPCVLVGTGDAWGESVNLQDTDLALFVMLPWTPRSIRQWEGRFSRTGQKRPVLVSYIISRGTVDEHVADILLDKLPAVSTIEDDATLVDLEESMSQTQGDLLERISGLGSNSA